MTRDEIDRLEIRRQNLRRSLASQGNDYLKQVLRLEINAISEKLNAARADA